MMSNLVELGQYHGKEAIRLMVQEPNKALLKDNHWGLLPAESMEDGEFERQWESLMRKAWGKVEEVRTGALCRVGSVGEVGLTGQLWRSVDGSKGSTQGSWGSEGQEVDNRLGL